MSNNDTLSVTDVAFMLDGFGVVSRLDETAHNLVSRGLIRLKNHDECGLLFEWTLTERGESALSAQKSGT